ncbi:MAG: hypothetical protein Q8O32_03005 [bacterium]|nr:hypothetical protein [bacterium]
MALLIEEGEPQNIYLIPVLENNGVVPRDDPDFRSLLDRMGVTDDTIPNTLRARFLQKMHKLEKSPDMSLDLSITKKNQGGVTMAMNLTWFENLDKEKQSLFIRHWELQCQRGRIPKHKLRFIQDVCLPILRAIHSCLGMTDECLDLVQLAESRDFCRSEIEPTIKTAYNNFIRSLNTKQAAKYLDISPRHCRRIIAKSISKLNGDVRKLTNGWRVPIVALDDWLLKHQHIRV